MKEHQCPYEQEVARATQSGEWSEELRSHATGCEVCADVASVAAFLGDEAQAALGGAALPDAEYIWWKAKLRARRAAAERAVRPIAILEKVTLVCACALLIALGRWGWPFLSAWLALWMAIWFPSSQAGSASQPNLTLVAGAGFFVFLWLLAIGLYSAWWEE